MDRWTCDKVDSRKEEQVDRWTEGYGTVGKRNRWRGGHRAGYGTVGKRNRWRGGHDYLHEQNTSKKHTTNVQERQCCCQQ